MSISVGPRRWGAPKGTSVPSKCPKRGPLERCDADTRSLRGVQAGRAGKEGAARDCPWPGLRVFRPLRGHRAPSPGARGLEIRVRPFAVRLQGGAPQLRPSRTCSAPLTFVFFFFILKTLEAIWMVDSVSA